MSNKDSISSFAQGSVSKAVLKNALPAIVAMIMVLIYNLADTFFIGQTHNDYMVAAVSLATPVFLRQRWRRCMRTISNPRRAAPERIPAGRR